jgi:hypothetical protein
MNPTLLLAIIEVLRLAGRLLSEARRTEVWTPEQEAAVRAAWEQAFQAPHWQPRPAAAPGAPEAAREPAPDAVHD